MTESYIPVMMVLGVILVLLVIQIIMCILLMAASWKCFKKMGYAGWEGIVPFYNLYITCDELYGNGWKFLLVFIPFYNIYFAFKLWIDYAHAFGESTGFGIGLVLLPWLFMSILGFGDCVYRAGEKRERK